MNKNKFRCVNSWSDVETSFTCNGSKSWIQKLHSFIPSQHFCFRHIQIFQFMNFSTDTGDPFGPRTVYFHTWAWTYSIFSVMAVCTLATVILPFTLLALMYPMRWFQHCIVAEVEGGEAHARVCRLFSWNGNMWLSIFYWILPYCIYTCIHILNQYSCTVSYTEVHNRT